MSAAWDGLGIGEVRTSLKSRGSGMRRNRRIVTIKYFSLSRMKILNFAECWYECLDLLPIYIWMFNNWSAPKTCGWLLKILWDWEEFEVAWIIIKGLLARSVDTSWCDHRFLYDPILSVRGGLTKTDYHLIASTKTHFQFLLGHNYFSCHWSTKVELIDKWKLWKRRMR